jgi:hypothetical protein
VWSPSIPGQIVLTPGKPATGASDTTTSIRIRALPENRLFGTASEGEILIVLQITPEPRLQWQRLVSMTVQKAIDDRDQKLSEATAAPVLPSGAPGRLGGFAPGRGIAIAPVGPGGIGAMPAPWMPWGTGLHQYTVVRLKKGEKVAKAIKELKGTISADLLGESQQLIVAGDILKAGGKTFKGTKGGSFKILGVTKADSGQITIRFEMEQPAGVVPDNTTNFGPFPGVVPPVNVPPPGIRPLPPVKGPAPAAKPAIAPAAKPAPAGAPGGAAPAGAGAAVAGKIVIAPVVGGPAIAMPVYYGSTMGVTLRDEKDNVLPARVFINYKRVAGAAPTREYNLTYVPQKGHGTPTKMVFSGRKPVAVNIPFTLKDIKLP